MRLLVKKNLLCLHENDEAVKIVDGVLSEDRNAFQGAAKSLVEAAYEHGSNDNISVTVFPMSLTI